MVARWRSFDAFAKFSLVVGILLVIQFTYATIAWLLGSHPVGALVPGVFLFFFASSLYSRLRYEKATEGGLLAMGLLLITGVASAISIVILWTLAEVRNDAVYHDQAVAMSYWGGATVVMAVLVLLFLATPGGRRRIRDQRNAARDSNDAGTGND